MKKAINIKMNSKFVLVSLIAVLTAVMLGAFASAATLNLSNQYFELDRVPLTGDNAVVAGETLPLEFWFTAGENASDVFVSAWIQGHRSERTEIEFADLIAGSDYKAKLSIQIPDDLDPEENLVLVTRVETDSGMWESESDLKGQRVADNLEVLLVDMDSTAKAGSTLAVSVVVKNMGRHEAEDTLVTVKIPELNIMRTAYFEDLFPEDECDSDDGDCDEADARERKLFLNIPSDAKAGTYKVEITAFNDDTESSVVKNLAVSATEVVGGSKALANPSSKTFAVGEEVVYELVLVNTGNKIAVYNLAPEASDDLTISLSDSVATVPAGSSKAVKVYVKAMKEGTFNFAVTATSDDATSMKSDYTATVSGKASAVSNNNIVVLTIVLAIVFVVLVIILIVLLTRKPQKSEEFGESYY
mgnify:CR=1 FL=1